MTEQGIRNSRRPLPKRCKSNIAGRPSSAAETGRGRQLKRNNTLGGERQARKVHKKKKRGLRVTITIQKSEVDKPSTDEDESNLHAINIQCAGKYHRKVCWPDVDSFWGVGKTVDKDAMCDILEDYTVKTYPERKGADNVRPKRCYLKDCPMRGISYYKDFGWDTVQLQLRPRAEKPVEIYEQWTRQVTLEEIPIDVTTELNTAIIQQGDKAVTSTLKKSPLQGHPLALAMVTSDTHIVVELRGLESVVGVLGNEDETTMHQVDEDTGDYVWRDVKTLRALLHDRKLPPKEGKGTQRVLEVVALETYLKARVYYKAYFEGDVVSDHGAGLLLGERWWAHPLKDIMAGFNIENSALVYEDIELRFFSQIGYKMDNEYFDWENHGGKWVKVKKARQP